MKLRLAAFAAMMAVTTATTAVAFDFDAPSFRSLGRRLGVGLGPGYHSVPCLPYHAKHYCRSVHGVTHPTYYATPLGQLHLYYQHQSRMQAAVAPTYFAAPMSNLPLDATPYVPTFTGTPAEGVPTPAHWPPPVSQDHAMPADTADAEKAPANDTNNPLTKHPLWDDSEQLGDSLEDVLPENVPSGDAVPPAPGSSSRLMGRPSR